MGAVCGGGLDAESAENKRIAAEMTAKQRKEKVTVKLLLLGSGDSGKTTLRKQMRNLYGEGFSLFVRKQLAPVVVGNLIDGGKVVAKAMERLAIPVDDENLQHALQVVLDVRDNHVLTQEVADALNVMWTSEAVQTCFERRKEFQLQDCWSTFMDQVKKYPEWGGDDWTPSVEDSIIARVRTSGIVEEHFVIESVTFKLFDVGGQRAERRKWIHCFDNVTACIFVVSLAEYDQVLYEDRDKNRLQESLELFDEICNSKWFVSTSILLFLNKRDLFDQKYGEKHIPLNSSGLFPDAPKDTDVEVGIDWIAQKFLTVRKHKEREIYVHVTTATDPKNVRTVFDTCKNIILKRNLEASGFLPFETDE